MRSLAFFIILSAALPGSSAIGWADAPASAPATQPAIDPALWARMTAIDARAAHLTTLSADFVQQKYTALLRKPLMSRGQLRVAGSTMRWDTQQPQPSVLLITEKQVRVYYPAQKTIEEYSIDQRMAELAASPLPRLAVLKQRFSFQEMAVKTLDPAADPAKFLALALDPIGDDLRLHIRQVRVLLDVSAGYVVRAELIDPDGDRTFIAFSNIVSGAAPGDLDLNVPPGVRIVHPLEGLGGQPPSRSR